MGNNYTWFNSDLNTSSSVSAIYTRVVGTAAQVTNGSATDSSIASAISAANAGDTIRILSGTFTENVSVTKQLGFEGAGYGTVINGTWTFANGSSYSFVKQIRVQGNMTINSGVVGIVAGPQIWFDGTNTFVDNSGNTIANILQGIQG